MENNLDNIKLYSNEVVTEFMSQQKKQTQTLTKIVVGCVSALLIQTTLVVGGILYFLNNFDVAVETTTETTTQTVEGNDAQINNVTGDQYTGSATHNTNMAQ